MYTSVLRFFTTNYFRFLFVSAVVVCTKKKWTESARCILRRLPQRLPQKARIKNEGRVV